MSPKSREEKNGKTAFIQLFFLQKFAKRKREKKTFFKRGRDVFSLPTIIKSLMSQMDMKSFSFRSSSSSKNFL